MGGIPSMLLMIAAAGITYGWQPDKNGDDSADVEYIIQVSPTELAQLQKSGFGKPLELSSVIDPEVRGHVSRIALRVGTGDLPRKTPESLSSQRIATLKPDPQGGGFGLPSSLQNSASDAVNSAANQFGDQAIDRAGRAIQNGADQAGQKANNLLDRMRGNASNSGTASRDLVPPPSTRPRTNQLGTNTSSNNPFGSSQPNSSLANQTPSTSPFAQPRAGGPSTAPTGQNSQSGRNNQWSRFSAQQQQQQNSRGADTSLASNGLRSSDTFGQLPGTLGNSGLSNRDDNQNLFANRGDQEQNTAGLNDPNGIYSQADQIKRDFQYGRGNDSSTNRQNPNAQSTRSGSGSQPSRTSSPTGLATRGYAGNEYLGMSRPNPNLTQVQLAGGAWDFDAYNRLVDRTGRLVRVDDRQPSFADRTVNSNAVNSLQGTGNSQPNTRLNAPSLNDPSLNDSRGNLNNNAYNRSLVNNSASSQARDAWGRPIEEQNSRDRYVRPQNTLDRDRFASNSVTNMVGTRDNLRASGSLGAGYPSTNDSNRNDRYADSRSPYLNRDGSDQQRTDPRFADQGFPARSSTDRSTTARPSYDLSDSNRQGTANRVDNSTGFASGASPDRISQAGFTPAGNLTKPKPVAAQPLFNGLLLISIVANLYLIFWLKNLRVQFKDMVAAKRMATSSASVA